MIIWQTTSYLVTTFKLLVSADRVFISGASCLGALQPKLCPLHRLDELVIAFPYRIDTTGEWPGGVLYQECAQLHSPDRKAPMLRVAWTAACQSAVVVAALGVYPASNLASASAGDVRRSVGSVH